ncbi:hypothetical protein, partial [Mariniphaga sediminis]|uniref:hypothetical protein n=1 Tax=Mariniphaga sediminis TaxID=1628158 RepID=UPI003562F4CF
ALDKAMIKHGSKQSESTDQSIDSIIKQLNQEQLNQEHIYELEKIIEKNKNPDKNIPTEEEFLDYSKTLEVYKPELDFSIRAKYETWKDDGWKDGNGKKIKNWKTKLKNTITFLKPVFVDQKTANKTELQRAER